MPGTRTDLEIAQAATLQPIAELARERLGIPPAAIEPYGHHKAKLSLSWLASLRGRPEGKLVLVTAMSPTPAGEGKTTVVVGLGDALNRIDRRAVIALREPSVGPVFGMKGGATGGGLAQVVPMEDINLNFTGDFAAVALAHNLLASMIDNHVHFGNELGFDMRRITWRRVMDLDDRALRQVAVGLGGSANGPAREDGFDIVAASEVMAILCLAESVADLKERLGDVIAGYTPGERPIRARDLRAHGAMAALLKDALAPNLVQTLERTPALVHGGPFANIAHGCSSVIATRAALRLGEYAVTEAGFGADLGAEKFVDIKCRRSGLRPDVAVVVATLRALKYHGGVDAPDWHAPNAAAIGTGLANLERHVDLVRGVLGLPCVVALNAFVGDAAAELDLVRDRMARLGVAVVVARHWAQGGAGAEDLAREVVRLAEGTPANVRFVYDDALPLWQKVEAVARRVYGASRVVADAALRARLERLQQQGCGSYPVCLAKTQYSFSTDPTLRGAPTGHVLAVRDVRLAAGAGFVVVLCGDVSTMPGLPRQPAAQRIDVDDDGRITGLC